MPIKRISIRNYRSIVSLDVDVTDLTILVGENDAGKSNVLRALDLFFNHDRETGRDLDWLRDYSALAPTRKNRADEITIELRIALPESFSTRKDVVWTKVWRAEGIHFDEFIHYDKSKVKPRSKIASFLRAMQFDYVPAIKGEDYFQHLMACLYDMLQQNVRSAVRDASSSFTDTINKNSRGILEEIEEKLGLSSTIELPANLRELFGQLEFTSTSGRYEVGLSQRGDGIRVRHIPIVLRWLAEQRNFLSSQGRPRTTSIWGFEEPENNLELRRCLALAQELIEQSGKIQAFVSTHSPIFYSVYREARGDDVSLLLASKESDSSGTIIAPLEKAADLTKLDSAMGLLEFLRPHVATLQAEVAGLKQLVDELPDTKTPTIFCEGPSDKSLLEAAIGEFFPQMAARVAIRCSPEGGGGHTWVGDRMLAWAYLRPEAKAVGLFDKDDGAKSTRARVAGHLSSQSKCESVCAVVLTPGPELLECYRCKFSVPYAIEETLARFTWEHAEKQGWLEKRENPISLYGFDCTTITFKEHIQKKLPDDHHRLLALKKVKLSRKKAFSKYVCGLPEARKREALQPLISTLEQCFSRLGLDVEGAA